MRASARESVERNDQEGTLKIHIAALLACAALTACDSKDGDVKASERADAPATTTPPKTTGREPVAPDNTGVNERDRDLDTKIPGDQLENAVDLEITQQVRKAIVALDTLSLNGKNVKVVTQNGVVTLRGPVDTAEEKATIEELARKVPGVKQVDNQLEVKGS
jgi:osmotically-inducible protein OsmY